LQGDWIKEYDGNAFFHKLWSSILSNKDWQTYVSKELFHTMDFDKSGTVSVKEFIAGTSLLLDPEISLHSLFRSLDADQSKSLSPAEIKTGLHMVYRTFTFLKHCKLVPVNSAVVIVDCLKVTAMVDEALPPLIHYILQKMNKVWEEQLPFIDKIVDDALKEILTNKSLNEKEFCDMVPKVSQKIDWGEINGEMGKGVVKGIYIWADPNEVDSDEEQVAAEEGEEEAEEEAEEEEEEEEEEE